MSDYNYHRTYDPSTGRYLESDPIGLQGGLNTYGYALQNPLKYSDPYGQTPAAAGLCFVPGVGWVGCATAGLIGGSILTIACVVTGTCQDFFDAVRDYAKSDDCDDDDEFCRKERERCSELCAEIYENPWGREKVFGGSISQCIKNCLPEKCGGAPKWKGYIFP